MLYVQMDHLLLHYPNASELWSMFHSMFGIPWVMPRGVMDILACWQGGLDQERINLEGNSAVFNAVSLVGGMIGALREGNDLCWI